ncbi:hypothetical protein ACFSGX_03920 [Sphingomonas arantia]|uniref:Uncharacterized protein n=1 Tax=Sphingomonas arantia TaxID=1460676 RepID=A0ABW4TY50_9SPHN
MPTSPAASPWRRETTRATPDMVADAALAFNRTLLPRAAAATFQNLL